LHYSKSVIKKNSYIAIYIENSSMSLFQKSVEKKYLNELDTSLIDSKYTDFQNYFDNLERQENIRNSKEEQFQEGFLRELFVNILGYTLNPEPNFNLTTELKNIANSKKADGAVLKGEDAIAVIELKGTDTTDLDKIETQAFGYKNHHPKCVYVITSNFEKLRFYIQNAVDHIDFDLFNLTKEQFSLMWLCLSKDNLISDIPQKIKESSVLQEENITKKLYADYSKFREAIYNNLIKNNPDTDKLILFKKTQKLLDRFLFIFFAEDRLLLPPNSISEIVKQWVTLKDELDEYVPLYTRFKKYFGYLNTGYKGKKYDIYPYNGGLFAPDEILDSVSIDDDILHEHTVNLSHYDFETDVDVNILGHIFEHSLGEIENVQAEIIGEKVDTQKTKRKKDGIFYTPKYITKYIVENTVGNLCADKRKELNIVDEEYAKGRKNRKKDTIRTLDEKLTKYRDWLLTLTILDPACGSGAFLNQTLEFLIEEHKKVDELRAQLFGGAIIFSDITTDILEKNIYGVDLNEESVEIAKLSLWLRTAQKGRKLNTLSNNIKCGNSLIDDPTVAGEKAFNWQKEFPDIFKEKEKKAWHITTATHDSRTSQRMIDYKVRQKRDNGLRPKAQPVWLEPEDEILVSKNVAEIVEEAQLHVLAYNICGDHMHLILVCEDEEVPKIVGKIKAITSRTYNIEKGRTIPKSSTSGHESNTENVSTRGHAPLIDNAPLSDSGTTQTSNTENSAYTDIDNTPPIKERGETQAKLWTQKFGSKEITEAGQLQNTIEYIQTNRQKHELPNISKELNPLINRITCTEEQAFRTEYKGGYDVIIGNPPYVDIKGLNEVVVRYIFNTYKSSNNRVNLYSTFIEKSISILKKAGKFSFIIPSSLLNLESYKELRGLILEMNTIHNIVRLPNESFGGASGEVKVDTIIITFEKGIIEDYEADILIYKGFDRISEIETYNTDIYFKFNSFEWRNETDNIFRINVSSEDLSIINKCEIETTALIDCADFCLGLTPYDKYKGHTQEQIKNRVFHADYKKDDTFKKLLAGNDIKRYFVSWNGAEWISYGDWLGAPREKRFFDSKRILIKQIIDWSDKRIWATLTEEEFYNTQNAFNIIANENYTPEYLIALINSNLISFYHRKKFLEEFKDRFQKILIKEAKEFPVKPSSLQEQDKFVQKVKEITAKVTDFNNLNNKFCKYQLGSTNIEKLSRKLEYWFDLEFSDFIIELNKAIKTTRGEKLSKSDEMEWMELFETKKIEIQNLKSEIEKTDKEIDHMVYELYGLSEKEIKTVEESL